MTLRTNGNYVFEEIMNSVSHGVGFVLAVIGSFVLIREANETYATDFHFWACVLYSVSLDFLFLFSCLFHSFFMLPRTSSILQILDHVGIYLLIAGSYTPFMLITLHHVKGARLLIIAEWIAAAVGCTFAACSDLNSKYTNAVELVFFLGMGFGLVTIWEHVEINLGREAFVLLLAGGAAYVAGIVFFVLGELKPIYHVIWHLFVILGAALHWFCIYFFVVNRTIDLPGMIISSLEKVINE
jgi:hemolysin III